MLLQNCGKNVRRKELHKNLKALLTEQEKLPQNYNQLFNASIKYLIKSGKIVTKFDDFKNDETLSLSPNGYMQTFNILSLSWATEKTMLQDKIRCAILQRELNN